jgi:hypothetical protein
MDIWWIRADARSSVDFGAPTGEVMRRALATALLALAVTAPGAAAADTPRPVVKSVSPLRAAVGEVMTITGRHFKPGQSTNVVVFVKRKRVVYVRADNATEDSISLLLPKKLERLMPSSGEARTPTRFGVKVISSRMGKVATRALAKPTIGPDVGGDCDRDGEPNPVDVDDDNDFLFDTEEEKARTNPCGADSDGDKLLDGWEYLSALDINHNAVPYPAKRPFPNALFADADVDYDGDGMPAWAEHVMWWSGDRKRPLSYSDGDQTTRPEGDPGPWDFNAPWGQFSDDERDWDLDGLANIVELRFKTLEPWEGYPGSVRPHFMDADTDGDGIKDGDDDQDHDDISNRAELLAGTWAMNPCDPLGGDSRTCPLWVTEGEQPSAPGDLCLSQTLLTGSVKWFEYTRPDVMAPEELAKFCPVLG